MIQQKQRKIGLLLGIILGLLALLPGKAEAKVTLIRAHNECANCQQDSLQSSWTETIPKPIFPEIHASLISQLNEKKPSDRTQRDCEQWMLFENFNANSCDSLADLEGFKKQCGFWALTHGVRSSIPALLQHEQLRRLFLREKQLLIRTYPKNSKNDEVWKNFKNKWEIRLKEHPEFKSLEKTVGFDWIHKNFLEREISLVQIPDASTADKKASEKKSAHPPKADRHFTLEILKASLLSEALQSAPAKEWANSIALSNEDEAKMILDQEKNLLMSMYPQLVYEGAVGAQINRMIGQRIDRKKLFQKLFERSADGKPLSAESRAQILTQALSIQLNPKEAEQMRLDFESLDQKIADATRDIISNNEKWIQKNENLDELLKNDDLILSALQSLDPQRGGLEYQALAVQYCHLQQGKTHDEIAKSYLIAMGAAVAMGTGVGAIAGLAVGASSVAITAGYISLSVGMAQTTTGVYSSHEAVQNAKGQFILGQSPYTSIEANLADYQQQKKYAALTILGVALGGGRAVLSPAIGTSSSLAPLASTVAMADPITQSAVFALITREQIESQDWQGAGLQTGLTALSVGVALGRSKVFAPASHPLQR